MNFLSNLFFIRIKYPEHVIFKAPTPGNEQHATSGNITIA
jgi:hypothetical protein